jgi:hypothetical protein
MGARRRPFRDYRQLMGDVGHGALPPSLKIPFPDLSQASTS